MPDLPLVLALSSTGEEAVMATTREHGARDEGRTMSKTTVRARASARELGDVPTQLAALEEQGVPAQVKLTRLSGHLSMRKKGDHEARNEDQEAGPEQVHG